MSKGNMLLGYARGKVGSLVFSRRKGEQVTRARNTHPANPRTPAQIQQRMKMYAPVKLYKSSIASQFVYAFEDQRANETAFNAFMRHNIANAPWVSKNLASANAPIPFPAELSAGSTPSVTANVQDVFKEKGQPATTWGVGVVFPANTIDAGTVAEFSTGMLNKYPSLREGDLITFVAVRSAGLSIEDGNVLYNGVDTFNFKVAQVELNTANPTDLVNVGLTVGWDKEITEDGGGAPNFVSLEGGNAPFDQDEIYAHAGAIIVSRKVNGKVIASNSKLKLNSFGEEIYNLMRTSAYRDNASVTYMATDEPLLDPDKID